MPDYRVTVAVDIIEAEDLKDAARQVWEQLGRPEGLASNVSVQEWIPNEGFGEPTEIDLDLLGVKR